MARIATLALIALVLASSAALAQSTDGRSFHPERYGREIQFDQVDRTRIHWTVNFRDFLDEQTDQLRLEIHKFKPVRFVRQVPLSTVERGTVQIEPVHYPSVEFKIARW